jgi:hypothetical protein
MHKIAVNYLYWRKWPSVTASFLALVLIFVGYSSGAEEQTIASAPRGIQAFHPGETLIYDISWSRIISAGIVTMEVKDDTMPDGKAVIRFVVTGHSVGLVDKVFPVDDSVQSLFDPQLMQSLSYSLRESFGKKKRLRVVEFDHEQKKAVSRLNEDPPETLTIPDQVQDGLSALYYLRTREEFTIGKHIDIDVLDSGKIWSVEIYILSREKVTTPAGAFDTIKVKTYPKYQGTFQNKGEVFIWLTNDTRKIPVLMKSKLAFGSFVFTLVNMKTSDETH